MNQPPLAREPRWVEDEFAPSEAIDGRWCPACGGELLLRRTLDRQQRLLLTFLSCWDCRLTSSPTLEERYDMGTEQKEEKPKGVASAERVLEMHHELPAGSIEDLLKLLALVNAIKATAAAVHDQAIGTAVDVPVVRGLHVAGRLYDIGPTPLMRRG